jgi:hypothetical protein
MRQEGINFVQRANAFLKCASPKRLQELADCLTARDLVSCGQKWLARLTPFFTSKEREQAGCQHRLFFSQVEYCELSALPEAYVLWMAEHGYEARNDQPDPRVARP